MYDVRLSKQAQRFYEKADTPLARKLNRCFDQLAQNPQEHPNIKRLKGELSGYFRYRLGEWRVVYQIEEAHVIVFVVTIAHRRDVYR